MLDYVHIIDFHIIIGLLLRLALILIFSHVFLWLPCLVRNISTITFCVNETAVVVADVCKIV